MGEKTESTNNDERLPKDGHESQEATWLSIMEAWDIGGPVRGMLAIHEMD